MTVLKFPIPLDSLEYETEYKPNDDIKKTIDKNKLNNKERKVSLLKDPVSIENIVWKNNETEKIIYNVKAVQARLIRLKRRSKGMKWEPWKQNALTIFENSFVYPFIHANNKYKCFICASPFLDANLLKDHTINEHNMREMKRELHNKVREKNVKVDVTYLQCRICSQVLRDLGTLKTHLKEHGKDLDLTIQDNIVPFKLGDGNFDCQICGERYLKLRLLVIHMSKHFNNYSCEICGTAFISLNMLKRHLETHETGSFPCDKCDKVFTNATKRRVHTRGVHLKQIIRRCPICPETFYSDYQRTRHLRITHNQSTGLFGCNTCGREFDLKYLLLNHIRSVHLQEKNHECPTCHSRFFTKHCLSRHMVIHTGEKNYKCEICGKAYARKKNLREHSRCHEVGICSDQNNLGAPVNIQ